MRVVCTVTREVDAYVSMSRAREIAKQIGFEQTDRTRIEIAVLELSRNILVHAISGELLLEVIYEGQRQGMLVEARDNGPGIADIALAMCDGFSTANTLGAGLPGVQRLMDVFEIESTVGVGTRVRAVKWLASTPRMRVGGGR
jgi:anti-sigma regulatory factor (Ser/Thr protein kinase)